MPGLAVRLVPRLAEPVTRGAALGSLKHQRSLVELPGRQKSPHFVGERDLSRAVFEILSAIRSARMKSAPEIDPDFTGFSDDQ